jgi:hypothetical protein
VEDSVVVFADASIGLPTWGQTPQGLPSRVARMATLSLHVDDAGRTALLRRGWSWLAALALPLWALHRQLWKSFVPLSLALFVLHSGVALAIDAVADETVSGLVALGWLLGWSIACGLFANRGHAWALRRSGYRVIAAEGRP